MPALIYFLGFSQHKAIGTSLVILLPPVGLGAVIEYYKDGNVDLKAAILVALSLFIGAWLSSDYASKITGSTLKFLFGINLYRNYIIFQTSFIL